MEILKTEKKFHSQNKNNHNHKYYYSYQKSKKMYYSQFSECNEFFREMHKQFKTHPFDFKNTQNTDQKSSKFFIKCLKIFFQKI